MTPACDRQVNNMIYKYYDRLRDGDDNSLWIKAKFSIILK